MKTLEDAKNEGVQENTIYNADCFEVMKLMPDNSVDLVLTDPPYGIGHSYIEYEDSKRNLKRLIDNCFPQIQRVAKRVAVFSGVQNVWLYPQAEWIIAYTWNTTGSFGRYGYNQFQPVLVYGNDIKGFGSVNNILKSDMLNFSGGEGVGFRRDGTDKEHACPKPLNVIRRFIARLSNEQEVVFDPFLGSGTTAVAAKQLGRKYIGVEISDKYCQIAKERLKQGTLF